MCNERDRKVPEYAESVARERKSQAQLSEDEKEERNKAIKELVRILLEWRANEAVKASAAMARRDAPGADDAQAPPTQPPRTSFFDDDDVPDDAEALASQVRADICTRKLRRERTKQTAKRANHNGAGASRNFSKTRTGHGKIRHKDHIFDSL